MTEFSFLPPPQGKMQTGDKMKTAVCRLFNWTVSTYHYRTYHYCSIIRVNLSDIQANLSDIQVNQSDNQAQQSAGFSCD